MVNIPTIYGDDWGMVYGGIVIPTSIVIVIDNYTTINLISPPRY